MTTPHRLLPVLVAATLIAACAPNTAAPPATVASPSASPSAGATPGAPGNPGGASAAPTAAPTPVVGAYFIGKASALDVPFANARVEAFAAGGASLGFATSTATGEFAFDFPTGVAPGSLLRVVASEGDRTLAGLVAAGGGNLVAAGGGNIVAAGGGNLVAAGGGNLVAAGGGNLVTTGGGNLVAAGGGNYRLTAVERGRIDLNLATTVAVLALGARLREALDRATTEEARRQVLEAADAVATRAAAAITALATDATLRREVEAALATDGTGTLSSALATRLVRADAAFATVLRTSAGTLGTVITAAGGRPSAVSFGGVRVSSGSSGGGDSTASTPTTSATFTAPARPVPAAAIDNYAILASGGLASGWVPEADPGASTSSINDGEGYRQVFSPVLDQRSGLTFRQSMGGVVPGRYLGLRLMVSSSGVSTPIRISLLTADGREVGASEFDAAIDADLSWRDFGISRDAATGVRRIRLEVDPPAGGLGSVASLSVAYLGFFASEP